MRSGLHVRGVVVMRDTILCIAFFIFFGLQCASCFAGLENERLAQLGVAECDTFDCWE